MRFFVFRLIRVSGILHYLAPMPNPYFQFKQFTVQQDRCAMKVCTDACLFGAIVAHTKSSAGNCLDIGAGTGLLSLMFAQQNPQALIDAVEIDPEAAAQAEENFKASPWKENLHIIRADIRSFAPDRKYDLVFSNPPFFEDDLRSADARKNKAKHDTGLSLAELLKQANALLSDNGVFAVLVPYHRVDYFVEEAGRYGLQLSKKIRVKQTEAHGYFRGILFFDRVTTTPETAVISIKDDTNEYTSEFTDLLRAYYLYL